MTEQTSRVDDMLGTLVEAVVAEALPLRGDGAEGLRERLRPALAAALRGAVIDPGGQQIDGARLTIEACRESAERILYPPPPAQLPHRAETIEIVARLLRDVREADQRERWIQEGYRADVRNAERRARCAEERAATLEHAVRLVKRATRDIRVGRE